MKNRLKKEDAVIILYDLHENSNYFDVDINKNYGEWHGKFDGKFEFADEIDSLLIEDIDGEGYVYYGEKPRDELKKILEKRNFKVELR